MKKSRKSMNSDHYPQTSRQEVPVNNEEIIPDDVTPKKKRGRKRKSESVITSTPQKSPEPNVDAEFETTRRGRKRKSVNYFDLVNPDEDIITEKKIKREFAVAEEIKKEKEDITFKAEEESADEKSSESVDEEEEECKPRSKRGRKPKTPFGKGLLDTLLLQAEFDNSSPNVSQALDGSVIRKKGRPKRAEEESSFLDQKTVTCAVCNKEMEKKDWLYHKQRFHNNLAWRVGEPALDLNNMDFVKYTLNALYVAKKPFHCEKCDKVVKSVLGYLSHRSACGKKDVESLKTACELCGRKYRPSSMPWHMKAFHGNKNEADGVDDAVPEAPNTLSLASSKRQAAEKALNVIKKFNLESSEIDKTFSKYFEDLPFISSEEGQKMLEKQIEESKTIECKYPDCDFECFTTKDIENHLKFCVKKPEIGYVCKHCLLVQLNIADMIVHIESVHNITIVEAEKTEECAPIQKKRTKQVVCVERKKLLSNWPKYLFPVDRNPNIIYDKAHEWTLEFCRRNYSNPIPKEHFQCLKADWDYMALENLDWEEYLPPIPYSCDVGFEIVVGFQDVLHKEHTFRKFEMFETYLDDNGNSTIFCGGPITALAWMPTPYDRGDLHQIVAVAVKSDPDEHHHALNNYNEKGLIQFWDLGPINNTCTSMFKPKQSLCLKFDHGPVWDLQWCPSGCFDLSDPSEDSEKLKRMGVLAVTGSDSCVYIYSIPSFEESDQFYNALPSLILVRNFHDESGKLGGENLMATRLSWTKARDHRFLAVGYSNGQVAIFHLFSDSKMQRRTEGNVTFLTPKIVLDAHVSSITALHLHHSHDGLGWLMTASLDRQIRTWDLRKRICVRKMKGNVVNDALWMTNWLCYIIGYDEASTIGKTYTVIQQIKENTSDIYYLFHCFSSINSVSGSDWLNGVAQGNQSGEIFATFPKQLMMGIHVKNMKNRRLLFGYNTLVEKGKTIEERLKLKTDKDNALNNKLQVKTKITAKDMPKDRDVTHLDYNPHYFEYEPLVYHEMDEKYGLVFCDHKMDNWSDFPKQLQEQLSHGSNKTAPSRPNMYPLQSVTKVQFNPNRQASLYYATGYQAGFLRLSCMKFLKEDRFVKKYNVNR